MHVDTIYRNYIEDVLKEGVATSDRTGTGTTCVYGRQLRFNLQEGFPLLTTKHVGIKNITSELLWFLKGDTNIRYLLENNNHIWNEWGFKQWVESEEFKANNSEDYSDFGNRQQVDEEFRAEYQKEMANYIKRVKEEDDFAKKYGDLGAVYGKQWRSYGLTGEQVDQIKRVIELIKTQPDTRRALVNAWNPQELDNCALPPCHVLYQLRQLLTSLHLHLYMRSSDGFLGLPYNIASYALLLHLLAQELGLEVGELIITMGDGHVYNNHKELFKEQFSREPYPMAKLQITPNKSIFEMEVEDIQLIGYQSHPRIKGEVAV